MRFITWLKSLFRSSKPSPELVPFYDVPTQRRVFIPPSELRPGCVQANVEGFEGLTWVLPEQLQQGPIKHPPFDDDMLDLIGQIQSVFAEHDEWSVDKWEDSFRHERNPAREIAGFLYAAKIYRLFTSNEKSPGRRREIYQLLMACMTTAEDSVWHVVKLADVSRHEAQQIVRRFYGGENAVATDTAQKPPQ